MERSLVLEHDGFKAIVREPERLKLSDYGVELLKGMPNYDFRISRYDEYSSLDFPIWNRTRMEGLRLPDYKDRVNIKLRSLESVIDSHIDIDLIDRLDFEGSDRKYTLLVDVFHNSGFQSVISGFVEASVELEIISPTIDENVLVLESGSELKLVRYVHGEGIRVSNDRFLIKKNSKLIFHDVLDLSGGTNISNAFLELEEGAEVEYTQIVLGGDRAVIHTLFKLHEGSRVEYDPRVIQSLGITDLMAVGKFPDRNSKMSVNGRGAVFDGKIIFRGVMDVPKGSKGVEAREKFKCLLLSDKAMFETIPSLFVEENEVIAEHGASSSPLSEDEIFYLESRGLRRKEVIKLLMEDMIEYTREYDFGENLKRRLDGMVMDL